MAMVALLMGWDTATHASTVACVDEIWLVSTRHLGNRPYHACCCRPALCYQQYVPCQGWVGSDECQYFQQDRACGVTIVYVHGNRIRPEDACAQGMALYRRLRCCCPSDTPIRFVIWSWPSSPIPAALCFGRDARVKYRRTDPQAMVLAQWLAQAPRDSNVTLIGYSFGARLVLGALHLIGGGCLEGCQLPCLASGPPCFNVALWAAATENSWLAPGGCHACALNVIQCGLITVNRADPVLRRFRRVILRSRERAMGHTGVRGALGCSPYHANLCELNVTRVIGRRHKWDRYCGSQCIIAHTARIVMCLCCGVEMASDGLQDQGYQVEPGAEIVDPAP